ncbi:ribosomal protein S7 domain-containing protein [Xylariomycetidae sp. FL2044]|nr:ribosomal protein S7 domain-containing protein [Xylariomycetidae sp. FL2044]
MASKLNPWGVARSLAVRTRPLRSHIDRTTTPIVVRRRGLSDNLDSRPPSDDPNASLPPIESRPPELPPPEIFAPNFLNAEAIAALENAAAGRDLYEEDDAGVKFHMPNRPGKKEQLQDRYHPVVDQLTKLLMKDGKLSKAQRHMTMVLNYLRTTPAPRVSPLRPLLPGAPPPAQLPLNPLLYLTLAIDSVAPLVKVRALKGMAGGGQALELPVPLAVRARRRIAIMWIIDAVSKKNSTGSGRGQFAVRFGQEIVAVIEGRSGIWDKRQAIHKVATAARANLTHPNANRV